MFDIITECLGFFIPAFLVLSLNMPWSDKFHIGFAFSFRLVVVVVSAVHLSYIKGLSSSDDPQLICTTSLLLQQTMLFWSLIASHIPSLRSLMASFSTGMGVKVFKTENATMHPSQPGSFALQTIGGTSMGDTNRRQTRILDSGAERGGGESENSLLVALRRDQAQHEAVIWSDGGNDVTADDRSGISRHGSQELIIRKNVGWAIDHGPPPSM